MRTFSFKFYHCSFLSILILMINILLSSAIAQPVSEQKEIKVIDVELATAVEEDKLEEIYAVGVLYPRQSVIIRPEVAGRVVGIGFKEGEPVEQGVTLLRLDASIAEADFNEAKAKEELAQQNVNRLSAARGGATAQALDIAKAELKQATARREVANATLKKMSLTAPFSGVTGLKKVEVGDYIQAGAEIVSLSNIEQLRLEFSIPERVAHVAKVGQQVKFSVDNFPNHEFNAEVYAVSPEIEQKGRSLLIRAEFHNENQTLIAGTFARLNLLIPLDFKVIIIPEEAIFASEGKQFVYRAVIDQKSSRERDELIYRAELTEVELGERSAFNVEILSGLEGGDIVVKAGQVRLHDGSLIREQRAEQDNISSLNDKEKR